MCLVAALLADAQAWDWLGQWGPAVPLFIASAWFIDRLFRRFVDKNFRDLKDAIDRNFRAGNERHTEHMEMLEAIARRLHVDVNNSHPQKRRKPPPGE